MLSTSMNKRISERRFLGGKIVVGFTQPRDRIRWTSMIEPDGV